MCWYINVISASFLFTIGQRRENIIVYQYIAVTHRVFFTVGRDHSANIINCATVRQISAFHHDASHTVGSCYNCCVKR